MAFKPNYNQQRAERTRAKQQKKQERLQRREADATRRKADGDEPGEAASQDTGAQDTEDSK